MSVVFTTKSQMDMSQTESDMSQTESDMSQTELDMSQTELDMSQIVYYDQLLWISAPTCMPSSASTF